ncbi:MAG: DUF4954 family protein [Mangrovibacterium sp.]
MTKKYRSLNQEEITQLETQLCVSQHWENVQFVEPINLKAFKNVEFSGSCKVGVQNELIYLDTNVPKLCGIYNAHIHNTNIGNNVYINNIRNYIANYDLEEGVIVDNCSVLVTDGYSCFGNGLHVNVMDETGGRQIMIYDHLSAHLAYLMAMYKHREDMIRAVEQIIQSYSSSKRSNRGRIGKHSIVTNTGELRNVHVGEYAKINAASVLQNGTIQSNEKAVTNIGSLVTMRNFIVASGSSINDGVLVRNCFIGQGCELGAQYSAENSIFFANCQGFHGEACAIFAGPYTVTHHKSTLLIAGMYSFLNAGSGSNQSNHMYKLGPIHHGVVERGSKTTSDSYILWPARIGAFTLIMGRHTMHSDTSNIPFSYLIENNNETWLVPAVNLRSVGTIRDALKWPRRDKRTDPNKLDYINFNLLSPFTIHKMRIAIETLQKIEAISGNSTQVFSYNNTKIRRSSLHSGIKYYRLAILKFIGNSVITRLNKKDVKTMKDVHRCLKPTTAIGKGEWLDISGLIAPKDEIARLVNAIAEGAVLSQQKLNENIKRLHDQYYEYEWTWTVDFIQEYIGKNITELKLSELIDLVERWKNAVLELDELLLQDAYKEFNNDVMTGFGIDGDSVVRQKDFQHVRGSFEENGFAQELRGHMERKTKLAQRVIEQLSVVKEIK